MSTVRPFCLALALAACVLGASLTGCLHINVMGRDTTDSELRAVCDRMIAREQQGLEPEERFYHGLIPSWQYVWFSMGPAPSTAQSRRIKRYVAERRRAAGLPELTLSGEFNPGADWRGYYFKHGDPRIFR